MKKVVLFGFIVLALFITGCSIKSTTGNVLKEDVVRIAANEITTEVRFFEHDSDGTTIRYFAVRGSDGDIKTAFDGCDVCGGSKGYEQIGTDIKCRNCGRMFSIDGLGTKNKGYGCWPSYLSHEIDGDNIVIKVNDLLAEKDKFN